jgi:hypothetical protein
MCAWFSTFFVKAFVSLVKRRMCILGPLFDFPSSDLHDMDGVTGHVNRPLVACGRLAYLALSITLTPWHA